MTRDGILTFLCAAAIVVGFAAAGLACLWLLAVVLVILTGA